MVMDHKSGVMVTADGGFVVARPDKLVLSSLFRNRIYSQFDTDSIFLSF